MRDPLDDFYDEEPFEEYDDFDALDEMTDEDFEEEDLRLAGDDPNAEIDDDSDCY